MANADELLREAEQALEQGQFDQAANLFEQAHDADPKSPAGAIGMAKVGILLGRYEDAMVILDKVLKAFPKHAEATTFRGVVDEAFGRLPAAISYYEKAAKLEPKLAVARFNLGRGYSQQGRYKDAIRELQVATRQEPQQMRFWDTLGMTLKESGDLPGAVLAFSEAIDINPLYLPAYLTLSDILATVGKEDLAEQFLTNAKGLFPEVGIIHAKLAILAIRRKDFAGAVQHLKNQTEVEPNNEEAWLNLSLFAMMATDLETAEQAALKATQINPANWRGFYHLGMIYDAANLKDQAKDVLRKSVANAPTEWKPFNNLANLLMEDANELSWREAAAMLGRALELCPVQEAYIPLYNLALAFWKLGEKDKAKQCAEEAVANGPAGDPTVEDARRFLGEFGA